MTSIETSLDQVPPSGEIIHGMREEIILHFSPYALSLCESEDYSVVLLDNHIEHKDTFYLHEQT